MSILNISCFNGFRCYTSSNGLTWNPESTQQINSVKKVYRTTSNIAFNTTTLNFDIAILELNNAFLMNEQVKAAALPTAVTPVGTNLIVSGWGTTSESNSNHLASLLYGSSINDVTQIYTIFTPPPRPIVTLLIT